MIPASIDIPPSDWSQLSPELQEQGQEEEPTSGERTMWTDRTTMVKKAYEDPSRTKAACELVQAGIMCLAQRVRTEKYETFLRILHSRNPNDTSNLYYIIHSTTSKGASRILAEDLIRPGDFSMHQDLHQSGFPTYGHCSTGQQAEEATLPPLKVKQLTKTILRTSQGSMAAFVCGIYAGLHPHQKHRVASIDEAQVLCGKYGIARGLHNTLVARSEHTTVSAVILTYQNNVEASTQAARSTSLPSVTSSSNLS